MMKKLFCAAIAGIVITATASGQYVQPNDIKSSIEEVFPTQPFDSIAAKNALAPGPATVNGVLYSKTKGVEFGDGFKTIYLFPNTPYFREWYDMKKKGVQVKKGMIKVPSMDSTAHRYSYWCLANVEGKFGFPNLKPGKYFLCVTVDKSSTRTYDRYQGSSYDNYGGQADHYSRENYNTFYKEDLIKEIEIPAGEKVLNVRWKE
ncbi:hypothetical protein [Taibaiella koreensis]|uniref:hypothetical protein n=1 Tax=Taibaiella koreensis TaxID=1268548 RepID=UPI0013C30C3A|nr:hypothetical protein [Taibaiella koreensis]